MNLIEQIRDKQNQLQLMIDAIFDEIIEGVELRKVEENNSIKEYESLYPLTNTTVFKGKKPIRVQFKNYNILTPTWKKVVEAILKEILKEENMRIQINNLRDKLLGRVRKRLSFTSDGMRSPINLGENLFIETHYDTETLMNLLLEILNEINYDYRYIYIAVKR